MVRFTEKALIIEIPTTEPDECLNNIQQSLLMSIQFMNPQMNPLDLEINPIYWISVLIENSLPELKAYKRGYNPEEKALILPEKLSKAQVECLRDAMFEISKGVKVRQKPNPITEILSEVA